MGQFCEDFSDTSEPIGCPVCEKEGLECYLTFAKPLETNEKKVFNLTYFDVTCRTCGNTYELPFWYDDM
jgi:ribosomal protein S27E